MTADNQIAVVGGCGHVGLPLGIVLAARGAGLVTLLDVDPGKVERINRGQMPFMENGADALLRQVIGTKLQATLDLTCLRIADVVI